MECAYVGCLRPTTPKWKEQMEGRPKMEWGVEW